jgi:oligopeptide transport system substrate-binding protein
MWREVLGIKIGLENVDFQTKLKREQSGDYQVSRSGWMGDFMDPITFLGLWWSECAFNDVKYNNPEYDALIKEAKSTNDQNVRMAAMKKAEAILMKDMPVIPIYFYTQPFTVKSNVSGVFKVPVRYPTITYADIIE